MERYVALIYNDITNQAFMEAPGSDTYFGYILFDMEALPLIIRGRINMLRLVEENIMILKVGSKGSNRNGKRLLYVYVDDEDIVDLNKLNPFVVIENYDPLAQ